MIPCSKCSRQNPNHASHCLSCGTDLVSPDESPAEKIIQKDAIKLPNINDELLHLQTNRLCYVTLIDLDDGCFSWETEDEVGNFAGRTSFNDFDRVFKYSRTAGSPAEKIAPGESMSEKIIRQSQHVPFEADLELKSANALCAKWLEEKRQQIKADCDKYLNEVVWGTQHEAIMNNDMPTIAFCGILAQMIQEQAKQEFPKLPEGEYERFLEQMRKPIEIINPITGEKIVSQPHFQEMGSALQEAIAKSQERFKLDTLLNEAREQGKFITKDQVIVDYFASLGVPDGLIIGDKVNCKDNQGIQHKDTAIFVGISQLENMPFICAIHEGWVTFNCAEISRPKKQPVKKSAREIAIEIRNKHIQKTQTLELIDVDNHEWIINAIEEALTLKTK